MEKGKMEMQNSALLYYQKNKTTKIAWQIIYSDRTWSVQDACGWYVGMMVMTVKVVCI
jgi:hypothetical protein